jgi:membrane protein DedA with SNARE-associated domain
MSFSDVSDLLLTYIVTYGAVVLCVVFLAAAVGVPLPSTLCVVAGGAFIQQGVLDLGSTIALGLLGVIVGDVLSYGMGRLLRHPIEKRYGQSALWLRAEHYFARRGGIAIFLTRCLLTPIALPINLIAGSSGYHLGRFVAYDAAGELAWLLAYGALGYFFGSQWEYVSDLIGNASGLLVGLLIAGVGAYALLRWNRRPDTQPPS